MLLTFPLLTAQELEHARQLLDAGSWVDGRATAGEQAVQASGCRHLLLRTSWVYGARGKNFFLTIRKLAQERDELKIVDDQVGAPTWCRDIANATAQIIGQLQKVDAPEKSGVYHLSAEGSTSWYGFAAAIVAVPVSVGLADSTILPVPVTLFDSVTLP